MWSSYSARAAAELIGLPESTVRRCIRDGLVGCVDDVPARLSFRDLAALRALRNLVTQGVALPRARRELAALAQTLPSGASVAELPLEVDAGRVRVRGRVEVGQLSLPLAVAAPAGEVRPLASSAPGGGASAPPPALPPTAETWFQRALGLEDQDPDAAVAAYQRALRLRPDWSEAWINLGRLHAERGEPSLARDCFESALAADPLDATAIYNLGVVAQDGGDEAEAIRRYVRALELDPDLAEAHYNLATLFDRGGDTRAAIRHINAYRKLTRAPR